MWHGTVHKSPTVQVAEIQKCYGMLCSRFRQAEVAALQQQLKDADEKYASQLLQARQAALDESFQRGTQQQVAIERTERNVHHLQQQIEGLTSALGVKEAELQVAHRQLAAAMDAAQQLEVKHSQVGPLSQVRPAVHVCHRCQPACGSCSCCICLITSTRLEN